MVAASAAKCNKGSRHIQIHTCKEQYYKADYLLASYQGGMIYFLWGQKKKKNSY